jgi:hypothetical protein
MRVVNQPCSNRMGDLASTERANQIADDKRVFYEQVTVVSVRYTTVRMLAYPSNRKTYRFSPRECELHHRRGLSRDGPQKDPLKKTSFAKIQIDAFNFQNLIKQERFRASSF